VAELPLYGAIAAGYPDLQQATEPTGKWLQMDESALGFRPDPRAFALRVRGDSMRDAGIFDDDTVVIDPQASPREGSIVAALIDGETTLKRLVRLRGRWFLKAENPDFPDLHPRESLAVQGVVRTVIRRLT
jgi:repressor LexA